MSMNVEGGRSPRFARTLSALAAGMLGCTVSSGVEGGLDVRRDATVNAIEQTIPSVLNIIIASEVERNDPYYQWLRRFYGVRREVKDEFSVGSGVIVDEDGYFITNHHVVETSKRVQVKLWDGRVYDADAKVGLPNSDLALLKIRCKTGEKFKASRLAKDDDLLLGETVIAIGNPFGLGGSVSRGILSSKSRREPDTEQQLDYENWLQTDAAINPGNSGGPLINLRGEVIGINVSVYNVSSYSDAQGMGVGFAIPVKQVNTALSDFFTPQDLQPEGQPALWFGARFRGAPYPLTISQVQEGSPAAIAGLKIGQLVKRINSRVPSSLADCVELLYANKDRTASLEVEEEGVAKTVRVQQVVFDELFRRKIGVTLSILTPQSATAYGVKAGGGMLVREVDPRGPGAVAQLQPGMLLAELDGLKASDPGVVARVLSAKKSDDPLRAIVAVSNGYTVRQAAVVLRVR